MSKMDNLRAMREARYDEAAARSKATSRKPAARPAVAPTKRAEQADAEEKPATHEPALCGHRAISGRVCTREHGHPQKSHRYS